jgi:hypothetical protein
LIKEKPYANSINILGGYEMLYSGIKNADVYDVRIHPGFGTTIISKKTGKRKEIKGIFDPLEAVQQFETNMRF